MSETAIAPGDVDLKSYIQDVPDFPKPGILFKDITPLLSAPEAFGAAIDRFAAHFGEKDITAIIAAEARGFIFAAPLALRLGARFVPVRKPGKLPRDTHSFTYELEYGEDTLEMHTDAVQPGDKILLVDDLLATGGTVKACVSIAEQTGASIAGCAFLIELGFLDGRKGLDQYDICSLITY
ncbi:adenine phosphoribosyltransferase [Stratiformator vulcanicus]|uniref:Adenine phosphoribosyltransferase n=1 Tax=Stratiformator vulcanicus TaxID=2527980 RepID=A0A517R729_9PLAN|nr:adenine phosphoribosyltransferase [Stratiformator vulcanicus]QDT39652.1 Adenine phosphoribosyltransferase [Stratiformator vulcanicus]